MYVRVGDLTRARAASEESLATIRKLAATDPGNVLWQRDVSVSLEKVGDVRRAAGDRAGALSAYGESLDVTAQARGGRAGQCGHAARREREPQQDRRRAAGGR